MTILKDSHYFSRTLGDVWWQSLMRVFTLGDVWWQSLMTVFNGNAFFWRNPSRPLSGKSHHLCRAHRFFYWGTAAIAPPSAAFRRYLRKGPQSWCQRRPSWKWNERHSASRKTSATLGLDTCLFSSKEWFLDLGMIWDDHVIHAFEFKSRKLQGTQNALSRSF